MSPDDVISESAARPFAPRLAAEWLRDFPDARHRRLDGTMVFADISGFTRLTERLARRGKVGAELMSDTLDLTFATLLAPAFDDGADLLKWGGDAVLLLLRGDEHAARAARAAHRMRAALRDLVRSRILESPRSDPSNPAAAAGEGVGPLMLRMSIGVHSGAFDAFLVGDPASHREIIVAGPDISRLVAVEQACGAGQILLSAETAAALPARVLGPGLGDPGWRLLKSQPQPRDTAADVPPPWMPEVVDTLPPSIRTHVAAGAGEPEHRPVAVGFVQFGGTDELLAREGAAAAADAVDTVVAAVQRACLRHGVTFFESDIAGDGGKIMLTAGAPRSGGHDAERMLRAAREIVEQECVLDVRVGVNVGHVFAGDLGPAIRRTYSIKGDAVNLAARLLGRAGPGEVIATVEATAQSRADLEVDPLVPFAVKGKRDPVHAVVVRRILSGSGSGASTSVFVGRRQELADLGAAVAAGMDGRGSIIDVVGEPGIGKTRLIGELSIPDVMRKIVTTVGSYETDTPYAAVGTLMRSALGLGAHETPEVIAERLTECVRKDAPDLQPWLPLLAAPLDVEVPSTREVDELDPRFRRDRIERATVALLAVLLAAPTLLLFEDAHLMDEASASLLHRLEGEVPGRSWCVIVTRRYIPVGYVPLLAGQGDRRISLSAMPPEDALELLESAAGAARPTRHALEAMADRAQGNPLFLTALATTARSLDRAEDLPGSVEAVLLVDIDRLSLADRTLLRLAAVLGTRFDGETLARLRHAPSEGDPTVDAADLTEIAGRLEEFVRPVEAGIMEFRHAMIRDVAYAGLPFRARRAMHERVALTLEHGGGAAADLLSLHFHAAGHHEKGWSYSLRAGDEARAKYAYAQAASFFERALDSAAHLPGTTPQERSAANSSLGDCLDMAGDSAGALVALRRARRDLRGDLVATGEVMYKEARITLRLGRYRTALAQLTRAMRLLDAAEGTGADAVRAKLCTRYGFCLHLQRRAEGAVRWGRLGVQWAESSGDKEVLAHACNALHLMYGASALEEDRPYGELALALYEELEDLSGQALTLNNLAIDAYNGGAWNDAVDGFGRAAESFHRLGDDANDATAMYNRADVLVAQGRHEEALPVLRIALRLARRVDDEELVGLVLREQARAEAAGGDRAGAWPLFDQAREVLAGLDLATEVALLDAARAEALADAGEIDQALDLIDRTIGAAEAKAPETVTRLHRIRAQALVAQGRNQDAAQAAGEGLVRTDGTYGGYETALLRLALADATGDDAMRADSRRVLEDLGVVA